MKIIWAKIKKALGILLDLIEKFGEITEKHKGIYLTRALLRATVLYFVFLASYSIICGELPDLDDFYENGGRMFTAFRSIFVFLIYFSLVRTFRVFDTRARRHFCAIKREDTSFSARAKDVLASPEFWIETLLFFAFTYLPIPANASLSKEIILAIFYKNPIPASSELIYVSTIYPSLYFVIGFLANFSARKYWTDNTSHVLETNDIEFNEEFIEVKSAHRLTVTGIGGSMTRERFWFERKKKRFIDRFPVFVQDYWGMLKWLVTTLVVYYLGLMIVPMMLLAVTSIIALLITKYLPQLLVVLAILLILIPSLVYSRKFRKRRKFIKALKKLCKEEKFELSPIRKSYNFKTDEGESFTVKANGKTYACKLIASKKKLSNTTFYEDGTYVTRGSVKPFFRLEVARLDTYVNYTFESEHPKVIILNPTPKRIFVSHGGVTHELDVGDSVCGYKLYTGSSFLNALERDCIERKANT